MTKEDFTEDDLFPDDYFSDETDRRSKLSYKIHDKFYNWTRQEIYKTNPTFEQWIESLSTEEFDQVYEIIMKGLVK